MTDHFIFRHTSTLYFYYCTLPSPHVSYSSFHQFCPLSSPKPTIQSTLDTVRCSIILTALILNTGQEYCFSCIKGVKFRGDTRHHRRSAVLLPTKWVYHSTCCPFQVPSDKCAKCRPNGYVTSKTSENDWRSGAGSAVTNILIAHTLLTSTQRPMDEPENGGPR